MHARSARLRRLLAALGGGGALTACAVLGFTPLGPHRVAPVPGAQRIGAEECATCHEEVKGRERIADYHADCESCHGGGSLHADSEAPEDTRYPASADCLACHAVGRPTHLQWGSGEHARAGLICSDCHDPHRAAPRHLRPARDPAFRTADAASRLCLDCHREVGAELLAPSHHPVREGMLSCLSCHDPHEDRRLAGGGPSQRCAGCHQDVMGPWIFEHAPVAEDCGLCHAPHGAASQDLLETAQPVICLSCHSLNDQWHHDAFTGSGLIGDPVLGVPPNSAIQEDFPDQPGQVLTRAEAFTFLRRCTDCHGAIHGSFTDEHLRH